MLFFIPVFESSKGTNKFSYQRDLEHKCKINNAAFDEGFLMWESILLFDKSIDAYETLVYAKMDSW